MVGWGGYHRATGAVEALHCGCRRGIAGATTMTSIGGLGDKDVELVGRFTRAGRQ